MCRAGRVVMSRVAGSHQGKGCERQSEEFSRPVEQFEVGSYKEGTGVRAAFAWYGKRVPA